MRFGKLYYMTMSIMALTFCVNTTADTPKIKLREIYRGSIQNEAIPTYHGWPTVANMGGDKLVAVASGGRTGHMSTDGRVYLYESDDKGRTWQGPRIMSNGPLDDRDAGIMCTPDGTWLLNYFTHAHLDNKEVEGWQEKLKNIDDETMKQELGFFLLRSSDQGKTWSPKTHVPVNNIHGPIILNDGTLFWQGKGYSDKQGSHTFAEDIVTYISADDGMTWQEISRIDKSTFPGLELGKIHELSTVQTADGELVTQLRCGFYPMGTWQMYSKDMGRTWSRPEPAFLGYPTHLLRLADSNLLTVYGYRDNISSVRARVSTDNGKTWSNEIYFADGSPTADLGYPSTVQFADGTLFTLWYQADPKTRIASLTFQPSSNRA